MAFFECVRQSVFDRFPVGFGDVFLEFEQSRNVFFTAGDRKKKRLNVHSRIMFFYAVHHYKVRDSETGLSSESCYICCRGEKALFQVTGVLPCLPCVKKCNFNKMRENNRFILYQLGFHEYAYPVMPHEIKSVTFSSSYNTRKTKQV